jgi:hypothetical protein
VRSVATKAVAFSLVCSLENCDVNQERLCTPRIFLVNATRDVVFAQNDAGKGFPVILTFSESLASRMTGKDQLVLKFKGF